MEKEFKLESFERGKIHFINYLKRNGYNILNIIPRNHERYMLLKTDKGNLFLMFKRDLFYSFGDIFLGRSESGETINADDISYCIKNEVKLIFVIYDNGNIYYQTPEFWLSQQHDRVTDNEGKKTYSISIKDLIRFNYDQEKILVI